MRTSSLWGAIANLRAPVHATKDVLAAARAHAQETALAGVQELAEVIVAEDVVAIVAAIVAGLAQVLAKPHVYTFAMALAWVDARIILTNYL